MRRNPVLHIELTGLEQVCADLGLSADVPFKIMETANTKKLQLRDRYKVVVQNTRTKGKVEKTIAAENDQTEVFNRILTGLVQIKQGKNLPVIFKTSKNYTVLKEIAKAAGQYCTDFEIVPVEEGYKKFIELNMEIMGKKFKLEKMKYYLPKIYDLTECLILIEKDINKEGTKEFYRLWKEIGSKYSTAVMGLALQEDYLHLIYGRDEADQYKAKYVDWITAQFEGLVFLNAVPDMNQLYGLHAKKRYDKYMAQKGIKKQDDSLMNPDRQFANEADRLYWDMVRKGKEKRAANL